MTKEQIAIELTKIYFDRINANALTINLQKQIQEIYNFFLEHQEIKIDGDPSIQVFDIKSPVTDLSKIKPIK